MTLKENLELLNRFKEPVPDEYGGNINVPEGILNDVMYLLYDFEGDYPQPEIFPYSDDLGLQLDWDYNDFHINLEFMLTDIFIDIEEVEDTDNCICIKMSGVDSSIEFIKAFMKGAIGIAK